MMILCVMGGYALTDALKGGLIVHAMLYLNLALSFVLFFIHLCGFDVPGMLLV